MYHRPAFSITKRKLSTALTCTWYPLPSTDGSHMYSIYNHKHLLARRAFQVKILQTSLGKINPFQTVQYILEQAQSLVQQHTAGRDHLDAAGFPTWKTEACRAWSTFAALARGTIAGLPSWCTGEKVPRKCSTIAFPPPPPSPSRRDCVTSYQLGDNP